MILKAPTTIKVDNCQSRSSFQERFQPEYLHDVCPPSSLPAPWDSQGSYNNEGGQLSKQVILALARDCQTRKSRAALNSFRVLRPPYWSVYCSAFLPSKREIVGFDACYDVNAEDVLARARCFCYKATRTKCLRGLFCCDFVPFPATLEGHGFCEAPPKIGRNCFPDKDTHRK